MKKLCRALALAAAIVVATCAGAAEHRTVVSGKTVYRDMGVEEVTVTAHRGGTEVGRVKSAYHGTFRLTLGPGPYLLRAAGTLPDGPKTRKLTGMLEVAVRGERLDRVVIVLQPEE